MTVFLLICIFLIILFNGMKKKSMFATRCKFVTVSINDNTYKLNNSEKRKMIELCEKNNWISGKAEKFNIADEVYREEYNMVVDFNNNIVKLYINTDTAQIKMNVYVSERENNNYYIADEDFIEFVNSLAAKAE